MNSLIKEIADNFYSIILPMPFRLKHVHVYAIVHKGKIALFDTGLNTQDTFDRLQEALAVIGRGIDDIEKIFVTHYHADHCGMAGRIQIQSGASIYMSEIDEQFLIKNSREEVFAGCIRPFYLRHGLAEETIGFLEQLREGFIRKVMSPFQVDLHLHPYSQQIFGNRAFQVIPAPGHTRGQVCFHFHDERLLLSGDHVLPDITPNLGPDLLHPEFFPLESFLGALEGIKGLSVDSVYPAHGAPFNDLHGRIEEMKAHHRDRKSLVMGAIAQGNDTAFLVSLAVFGTDLPVFDQFLALNESYVHIIQLVKEGLVCAEDRDGCTFFKISHRAASGRGF
jgi:glyoxylase-like metal-dependent hydrolase (beta-lactamase superfamily II)